jgi:ribosomal protein L11 methyltransferase
VAARKKTKKTPARRARGKAPVKKDRHVILTLNLPMSLSEPASELLWDLGVLGVMQEDDETRARADDPTIPKTGLATVKGTFLHKRGLEARIVGALQGILTSGRKAKVEPNVSWEDVPDQDWNAVWMERWKPLKVSGRIWVVPSWEREKFEAPKDSLTLWMDPGMAFGTGTHETTQLCTQDLERVVGPGVTSLLDVGTGSGILALAAAKLAEEAGHPLTKVVGIDIDLPSVRAAAENAEANGVKLDASATPVERLRGSYDVVVANILLNPLKELKEHLVRLTAPKGALVLSGILETQRRELEEAYRAAGMRVVDRHQQGEWACIVCRR